MCLHRDVKPGNVLVAADGRAVLTDFGIATARYEPSLTQTGIVLGSPGYLAPSGSVAVRRLPPATCGHWAPRCTRPSREPGPTIATTASALYDVINPGTTVRVVFAFDMPTGTRAATIALHDSVFSGGATVNLPS